jgi:CBS domain-containing protein
MAAIMLSVELLLFELKPRSLIPVITSCVVAAALRPSLIGHAPLFPMTDTPVLPWWGLIACLGAGILAGLQSGAMTGLLYKTEEAFERLPIHWMWWPAIGGVVVGLGGLIEPRALGVGYDVIRDMLSGAMTAHAVTAILLVKSGIWIVALASGTSGGVLAPLLIMGGALGWIEGQWLPGGGPFWSLVGMASMMGGTMRAPLTGVLFALELTDNIHVLLPLMIATGAAYALTVLLLKRSILTEKIARRGQHITREYSTDPFELLRVGEMMVRNVDALPAAMSIDDALAFFSDEAYRHKSYPVVDDEGRVVAMVGRADAMRWRKAADRSATLYESVSDRSLLVGYPDEVLARVADRMVEADLGRIPIVDRATRRLVGLVARKDLMRTRLVTNRAERERAAFLGHRAKTPPRQDSAGT